MPRTLTFPLAAIAGSILALGLGCSADRTLAPAPGASAVVAPTATASHSERPARLVACIRRLEASDTELVGRRGGTLRFGGNTLEIPEGALDHTVRITARVVPNVDYLLVDFEPSGLRFDRPATLSLNVAGCAVPHGRDPDVVYVDHDGRILERIGASVSRWWNKVVAPIQHFSAYSIAL